MSNNSFKPNLLRYSKSVAQKACHAFASTTQVGLIPVLGIRMRILAALALTASLTGCSGESTMPAGFNEACYGGDFDKNLTGAKPAYSATLRLSKTSLPTLRKLLFQLAEKHHLKAFDDGATYNNQFFLIYLCSAAGNFSYIDSRTADKDTVRIDVFSYKSSWHPEPFVADLESALSIQWPNSLKTNDPANTTLGNSLL